MKKPEWKKADFTIGFLFGPLGAVIQFIRERGREIDWGWWGVGVVLFVSLSILITLADILAELELSSPPPSG